MLGEVESGFRFVLSFAVALESLFVFFMASLGGVVFGVCFVLCLAGGGVGFVLWDFVEAALFIASDVIEWSPVFLFASPLSLSLFFAAGICDHFHLLEQSHTLPAGVEFFAMVYETVYTVVKSSCRW